MIKENIKENIKKAMVNKDTETRDALRFLMSKIQQQEIDSRKEATDESIVNIIKKLIKQNKDSLSFDPKDKDKILGEISIWGDYLPAQLSKEEIASKIEEIVSLNNFKSIKDMGKIMGLLKKELGAQVDMSVASRIVKSFLT